jgi:hypothetical protein
MVRKQFLKFPVDELVCNFIFTANCSHCEDMRFLAHYNHKQQSDELHNLETIFARYYCEYSGHVTRMGKMMRNVHKISAAKTKRKTLLRRPRHI